MVVLMVLSWAVQSVFQKAALTAGLKAFQKVGKMAVKTAAWRGSRLVDCLVAKWAALKAEMTVAW